MLLPVAAVAVVLAVAVGGHLHDYNGNLTGFVQFGSYFAQNTHPPHGAVVLHGGAQYGYDGQFYYVLARDPLLLHESTLDTFGDEAFRSWRVAYPALAFVLAGGQARAIPAALLALNIAVVLALTAVFAIYARRRGWSTVWALVIGLLPGLLLATLRDLTDPLATAAMLCGLLAWSSRRRGLAAALLTVAVLSREVMVVAAVGIAVDAGIRAWRRRATGGDVREALLEAWPVVVIPAVAFLAWQAYVAVRFGAIVHGAGTEKPFGTFLHGIRDAAHSTPKSAGDWDIAYELLMIAAIAAALWSLRKRISALSITAALLALTMTFADFSPIWGDTRDSAPVFALLLIIGLECRRKLNLWLCSAAAAMTALIPIAIPGIFPG